MIIIIQMSYAVFEGLKSLHMNAEVQNYKWLSMQMKSMAHSLDWLHLAKASRTQIQRSTIWNNINETKFGVYALPKNLNKKNLLWKVENKLCSGLGAGSVRKLWWLVAKMYCFNEPLNPCDAAAAKHHKQAKLK